jgi:hypothetical protein
MKDRQLLTVNIRDAMENVRKIARVIEAEQA